MRQATMTVADEFLAACKRASFRVTRAAGGVVTIARDIKPDDMNSFRDADMDYGLVLLVLRARGGSQWGTDGSGVGAWSAMRTGQFVMNQSGVGKLLCAAIEMLAARQTAEGGAR